MNVRPSKKVGLRFKDVLNKGPVEDFQQKHYHREDLQ